MVIVSGFQTILLYACLGMLGVLALFSFMALVCEPMKRLALRIRGSGHLNALLALLAVAALVAYGGTKPLPVPPEGAEFRVTPYVQHPATNAMSVLWLSATNVTATIEWWPEGNRAANRYAVVEPRLATELDYFGYSHARQCLPALVPWQYRYRIEGLQPDTKYEYCVTLASDAAAHGEEYSNSFRTAPAEFRPVHFVAYSDSETQPSSTGDRVVWENYAVDHDTTPNSSRRYYIDQTDGYATNICAMLAGNPDFFVIAGDLAEKGSDQTHWDEFWRHNAGELNDPAGSIPILAAPGNHEYHGYYAADDYGERGMRKFLSYFEFEPNGAAVESDRQERFHRLDYGPVAIIFIDTNNGQDYYSDTTSDVVNRENGTPNMRDTTQPLCQDRCRAPDFNPGSAQYQWLEEQLADAQTNKLFTFIVNHQCPFSVGYHGRLNGEKGTESSAEYLSGAATRCLTNLVFKYGVDAWISGHDELYEHSQLTGIETLPDGTARSHTINIYDVGMGGDGLRGCNRTGRPNPYEVFRAHVDAPEVYDSTGTLVSGGKHYGHMDVNVTTNSDGLWTATLTPTYVFVSSNTVTGKLTFDRRAYPDTIVITNAPAEAAENVIRAETIDGVMWHYIVSNGVAEVTSGTNRPAILPVSYPGEITVPSVLGGFPVMKIGDYAFYCCTGLTDVTIPEGVAIIGDRAFVGCRGLASVTIPNSVMQVGTGVFSGCINLTSVTLPQYICAGKFKSVFTTASTNITDVVIADGVTNIGASTFANCTGLASVTVPGSVSSLGNNSFAGCRSLESVTFNGNAPSVGTGAFSGVSGECTVRVRRDSTGWGVAIPGTWNGLRIEYIEGDAQSSSLWYEDPHAVAVAEGLPGQTDGNIVHAFHGQGQGEYLGLTYTTNPQQFDLFRVNGTNAPALVTSVPVVDLDNPGLRGVAISKTLGIAMTLAYAKTTTMYAFPLSGGAPTAVTKPGTHAFDSGAFSPDGRYFFSNAIAGETANTYYVKWAVSVSNGVVKLTRIGGIAASGRSRNLAYARINGRDLVFGMVDTGKISVIDMTGNTVANWSASDMITDLPAHSYGSLCVSGVNTAGATPHLTVATSYNNGATKGDVLNVYELTVPSSGAVTALLVRSFDEDAMTAAGFGDISDANRYGNTVYVTDDNTTIYFARPDGKLYAYTTAAAGTAEPAEIRNVTAKQRYPWNGKVDITFNVVGDVTAGLPDSSIALLSVTASNRVDGVTYAAYASALSGDTGTEQDTHHVVWDLDAQGLEINSDEVVFTVAYEEPPPPYCVIDLSGGASASSYPVTYLAEMPSGGWTDEYKTTKLVLRLVEPGTFMMGGSYQVTLTKPFYCGVFEVTQKQYELVTGDKPSYFNNASCYATRPVEQVSYNMIRGSSAGAGWPGSSAVDGNSFLGKLQARTGLNFDLPTEAQWEYACRAGTTTDYNSGKNNTGDICANMDEVGRYYYNVGSVYSQTCTTESGTAKVGSYLPNAWGLYDMHGNVWEWCLDWYGSLSSGVTDPVGSSSGSYRVLRGGSRSSSAGYCTSSYRYNDPPSGEGSSYGFRLVRTLSNTEGERGPEAAAGAERAVICAAEAAPVAIESPVVANLMVDSIAVTWDASWVGGDAGATVVIADNGVEVKRATGAGEFTYAPTTGGLHELTYTTYIGNVAQPEVYSAVLYKATHTVTLSWPISLAAVSYTLDGDPGDALSIGASSATITVRDGTVVALSGSLGYRTVNVSHTVTDDVALVLPAVGMAYYFPLTATAGQDGSAAHPYEVADGDGVLALQAAVLNVPEARGLCFAQTADIDMTGVGGFYGIGWFEASTSYASLPEGVSNRQDIPFTGTYDGQGHTISNVTIVRHNYAGVFNNVEGTVKNLTVQNIGFSGTCTEWGCAIVGNAKGSAVLENLTSSGTVWGDNAPHNIAGIVVRATDAATVRGCVNNAAISSASKRLGGIAAFTISATEDGIRFIDCTNNAALVSTDGTRGVGGILGCAEAGTDATATIISGCVDFGSETAGNANGHAGAIVGSLWNGSYTYTDGGGNTFKASSVDCGFFNGKTVYGLAYALPTTVNDTACLTTVKADCLAEGNTYTLLADVAVSGTPVFTLAAADDRIAFDAARGYAFAGTVGAADGLDVASSTVGTVTTYTASPLIFTVSVDGNVTNHAYGDVVTFTAPEPWDADGMQVVTCGTTFTAPVVTNRFTVTVTNDIAFAWDIFATNFWFEVEPPEHGAITGAASGWRPVDDYFPVQATVDAHYHFVGWTGDVEGLYQRGQMLYVVMDQPRTIGADIAIDTYSVTFNLDGKAARTGGGELEQTVAHGSAAEEPAIEPFAGWRFIGWDKPFAAVTGELAVNATFERIHHEVVIVNPDGSATTNDVEYGTALTFTAPEPTVDELCKTQIVYVGTTFTAPVVTNEFTVTVTNDVAFSWDILATNWWFEVSETQNGTITAPEAGWMADGTNFTLVAVPAEHYHFVGWTGDTEGCIETNGTELAVTMDRPRTIGATFAIDTYSVTFNLDGKAARTGGGELEQTVAHGSAAEEPAIEPFAGWRFIGWDKPFAAVTGELAVNAEFERIHHEIVIVNSDGSATTNDVEYGTALTFTAPEPTVDELCKTQIVYVGTTFTAPVVTNEFTVTVTNDVAFSWDILATNWWFEVSETQNGSITAPQAGWMADGVEFIIAAVPAEHHHFVGWAGDTEGCNETNGTELAVAMYRPRTIGAEFAIDTYSVTFNLDGKAARTGGGELEQTVAHGSAAEEPAIEPFAGWRFIGWDKPFAAVTGELAVNAAFERIHHDITITNPDGSVTKLDVEYGATLTFTAPEPTVDELCRTQIVYAGTSYTAPTVTNRVTVVVTNDIAFAWDIFATNFWFEVSATTNGTITAPEAGWMADGTNFTLVAVPAEHYHFVGWTGDTEGCIETNGTELAVTMDRPRTVGATFAIDTFTVTFEAGAHGSFTGEAVQAIDYGGTAAVPTVTPDTGYEFTGWSGDTAAPIVSNATFTAQYAAIPYAITYTGLMGAANPNPATYTVEDMVTFADPGAVYGWVFTGWSPASIVLGSTGAIEVTANWERAKFDVTVNGETRQYDYEDVVTFTAPEPWDADGMQVVTLGTTFTDPVVTNEFTVTVTNGIAFDWDILATNWWFEVSATTNGSVQVGRVDPNAPEAGWIADGETLTLTAVPSEHYHFVGWTGDWRRAEDSAPYQGEAPEQDAIENPLSVTMDRPRTIGAEFAIDTFTVTFEAGAHGSLAGEAVQAIDYGGTAAVPTVTPDTGYEFTGWSGDTAAPIVSNATFTAQYAAIPYAITYTGLMGSANPNPATYTVEDSVTFADPGAVYGWVFTGWTPASIALGSTGDIEVAANWERAKFDVVVGGVTNRYSYEESVTFIAPEPTVDELCRTQIVYVGTTFTAPVVTNEFTVTVTNGIAFDWDILATNWWFEVSATTNGTITAPGAGWMADGTNFTLVAVPAEHYHFVGWTGDTEGCIETNGAELVVTMDRPRTIGAEFTFDVTLAQSVNADDLEWTTGGAAEWQPEWSENASDGKHDAYCGAIGNGTNAWISATVEGVGTISFKWQSALASRNTKYQFMVDGEVKGMLTGTNGWTEAAISVLGDRAHELKWRLLTGRSGSAAGDRVALDEVVWTATVPPTLAEALNTNLVWTTDGDVLWRTASRESLLDEREAWALADGLGDDETSAIQTRVFGSGVLVFDWAISCEEDYDWMELTVDGEVRDYITGEKGWTTTAIEIAGDGWHTVRWEYIKDEMDDEELVGDNVAKLDNVVWRSEDAPPTVTETQTTPIPVPYAEIETRFASYLEQAGGDYEAAAHMVGRNGYAIWECYLAGLNPDDESSKFKSMIEMVDGKPVVTWEPDTPELRATRVYRILGRKNLGDPNEAWVEVKAGEEGSYNFFKVEVDLP